MAVLSHWQPTKNKAGFGRRDHAYTAGARLLSFHEPESPLDETVLLGHLPGHTLKACWSVRDRQASRAIYSPETS